MRIAALCENLTKCPIAAGFRISGRDAVALAVSSDRCVTAGPGILALPPTHTKLVR